ncbi:MAG: hypothetical protein GVY22_00410 [Gammaproteobacteria bacterium]|jgi:hypothetical protein|nr:hypothetical protein [Gammaproteobacteria bacterium]
MVLAIYAVGIATRLRQVGTATVEMLIVVPVLFLLVTLILEVTNILRVYEAISWTTEYGVREASGGMGVEYQRLGSGLVNKNVFLKLVGLGVKNVDLNQICTYYKKDDPEANWDGPFCAGKDADASEYSQGDLARVVVEVQYEPFVGFFRKLFPSFDIRSSFQRVLSR